MEYYLVQNRANGKTIGVYTELPENVYDLTDSNKSEYSPEKGYSDGVNDYSPMRSSEVIGVRNAINKRTPQEVRESIIKEYYSDK